MKDIFMYHVVTQCISHSKHHQECVENKIAFQPPHYTSTKY